MAKPHKLKPLSNEKAFFPIFLCCDSKMWLPTRVSVTGKRKDYLTLSMTGISWRRCFLETYRNPAIEEFWILSAVVIKTSVFWDLTPCSWLKVS
jgi:hypothetical protein